MDVYALAIRNRSADFRTAVRDCLKFATIAGTEYLLVPDSLGTSVSFFKQTARRPSFVLQTVQDAHDVAIKPAGVP